MDKFVINGRRKLSGSVALSGSKNAALPIMAACLLADGPCELDRVPDLADVRATVALLGDLGMDIARNDSGVMRLHVRDLAPCHAQYDRVRKMRASICVLGPLLARRGKARVAMPGGCAIGSRPVNLHLRGLRALGAKIELDGGDIVASADRLKGAEIFLGGPFGSTVLGTANVMMAAALAKGTTVLESAACEPELVDLADFLNAMGARIRGAGSPRVTIEGVESLTGKAHSVIPDRIEAGTFLVAGALGGGPVNVLGARADHLMAAIDALREIGVNVESSSAGIEVAAPDRPLNPCEITTHPHPGFPTDLQAQFMVLLSLAAGNSALTEKVFPDRFMHVAELLRMGADIRKEGPIALISGVKELVGAPVMASDLRASAALVLAGLVARGRTDIARVYHIDRGYEHIESKLNTLGADIRRISE
ncbi:MAG: UDP-N-acetylglucosamine 1-carboxyvinyltransferase [Planctomycetaceae bacterium]|nr:UDP-N-acetylglucosamine 1-carboxyvinyltransferase [Planctomycetaceae bacterium]